MNESFEDRVAREMRERADALDISPDGRRGPELVQTAGPAASGRARMMVVAGFVLFLAATGGVLLLDDRDQAGVEVRDSPDVSAAPTSTEPAVSTTAVAESEVDASPTQGYPIPGTDLYSLDLELSITPSEDLVEGQEVAFEAEGFTPFAPVGVVQCLQHTPPRGQDDCDLGTVVIVDADHTGVITGVFTVARFINTADGTVDCAAPVDAPCGLGMGNTERLEESGGAPLSFDADEDAPVPPRLAVSVTTGLEHGQLLGVVGSGFEPFDSFWLLECAVRSEGTASCFSGAARVARVSTDELGEFTTTIPAFRVAGSGDEQVDCAESPGRCIVSAASSRVPNTVQLEFDPAGPLPVSRAAFLQPVGPAESDLVEHGQVVVVHLAGFGEGPVSVDLVDHTIDEAVTFADIGSLTSGAARVPVQLPELVDAHPAPPCAGPNPHCELVVTGPGIGEIVFFLPYPIDPSLDGTEVGDDGAPTTVTTTEATREN